MGLTISTTYVTGKRAGETVVERKNTTANPYIERPQPRTFGYKPEGVKKNPYAPEVKTGKNTEVSCQPKQNIAKNDAIKAPVRYTQADAFVRNNAKNDLEKRNALYANVRKTFAEASVNYVISTDVHKPRNIDISRISSKILAASEYTGVDADSIACIVKRESHFKETGLNVITGKGPMGLTSIAIKDLYTRPRIYDSKLEGLIKKYGSLQKLFAAKKTNPSIDLGNFGDILYQYGSWTNLRNAIKKDYELNLKVGAYIYKYQLNKSLANSKISITNKEREAFKNYNGSYLKNSYANSSVATLKAARAAASQDEKYLAALEKTKKQIQVA